MEDKRTVVARRIAAGQHVRFKQLSSANGFAREFARGGRLVSHPQSATLLERVLPASSLGIGADRFRPDDLIETAFEARPLPGGFDNAPVAECIRRWADLFPGRHYVSFGRTERVARTTGDQEFRSECPLVEVDSVAPIARDPQGWVKSMSSGPLLAFAPDRQDGLCITLVGGDMASDWDTYWRVVVWGVGASRILSSARVRVT